MFPPRQQNQAIAAWWQLGNRDCPTIWEFIMSMAEAFAYLYHSDSCQNRGFSLIISAVWLWPQHPCLHRALIYQEKIFWVSKGWDHFHILRHQVAYALVLNIYLPHSLAPLLPLASYTLTHAMACSLACVPNHWNIWLASLQVLGTGRASLSEAPTNKRAHSCPFSKQQLLVLKWRNFGCFIVVAVSSTLA